MVQVDIFLNIHELRNDEMIFLGQQQSVGIDRYTILFNFFGDIFQIFTILSP